MGNRNIVWYKVLENKYELVEGRVMTVTAGHTDICLSHYKGKLTALTNKCPHQGGPLGEGSIENGLLRCPWHGWDYNPCTGRVPGFEDGVESFETFQEDVILEKIRTALTKNENVKDVFITDNDKNVVGWLTDTLILRFLSGANKNTPN